MYHSHDHIVSLWQSLDSAGASRSLEIAQTLHTVQDLAFDNRYVWYCSLAVA